MNWLLLWRKIRLKKGINVAVTVLHKRFLV